MFLVAIIFPPLAVLLCRKPVQALVAVVLTICFWIPGIIYAWLVVADFKAEQRNDKLIRAVGGTSRTAARHYEASREADGDPFAF